MPIIYSAYEAKARFSEVLRQVRAGKTITISYRGEPVAEIRPLQTSPVMLDERLDELEQSGILVRSDEPRQPLCAVERRPGALDRFLAKRNG
ncbi:MAG: type II toxin-antitoxin system prevent-host-death family antitoxin [Bacteroidetes bacterium SB0662_bin_6]|nr:type II toxin-antitoxin system prevent-host-death family antitoxin [Bacteroidetes bacterium SB0668_bin_1]MYE05307.1 type II toxin-antitoxin system prevent-host-death family antitoxin [Bacteroidetes bacterium SB0662_bin_6]